MSSSNPETPEKAQKSKSKNSPTQTAKKAPSDSPANKNGSANKDSLANKNETNPSNTRNKKPNSKKLLFIIFGAFFLFFLASTVLGFTMIKRTPRYSLFMITRAIKKQDYETFEQYFDTEEVVEGIIDDALDTGDTDELTQGFAELFKPMIVEGAKDFIEESIENGDDIGNDIDLSLTDLFTEITVETKGKEADVTINLQDDESFSLTMSKKDNKWIVVAMDISDFEDEDWGEGLFEGESPSLFDSTDFPSSFDNEGEGFSWEEEKEIITGEIGEEISTSEITFTINSYEELDKIEQSIGNDITPPESTEDFEIYGEPITPSDGAKFVKVDITITNNTKQEKILGIDDFIIRDHQEREYNPKTDIYWGGESNNLMYENLPPSITKTGFIFYEVPQDSKNYKIVRETWEEDTVYEVELE